MHIANKKDLAFGFVLLLVSCFLFYETFNFRKVAYFSIGPAMFPRILLTCLILLSTCLIVQSLSFTPKERKKEAKAFTIDSKIFLMQALFVALVLAYGALLPVIGYVPCTCAFLFSAMLLLGKRTPKAVALYGIISVGTAFFMQLVFQGMLHLFLP